MAKLRNNLAAKAREEKFVRDRLPNVNSSVSKPEADSADTMAQGPGIGITSIFSFTHNFACGKDSIYQCLYPPSKSTATTL